MRLRRHAGPAPVDGIGNRADMLRCRPATTSDSFNHPSLSTPPWPRHIAGTEIVAAEPSASRRWDSEDKKSTDPRQLFDERRHQVRTKSTIDSNRRQIRMGDRGEKRIECLPGKSPSTSIGNRHGREYRQSNVFLLEKLLDGEKARL